MKKETIYFIVKWGVYMQGIYGIYKNLNVAKERARYFADKEYDGYHSWDVYAMPVDHELSSLTDFASAVKPRFSVRKGDPKEKSTK